MVRQRVLVVAVIAILVAALYMRLRPSALHYRNDAMAALQDRRFADAAELYGKAVRMKPGDFVLRGEHAAALVYVGNAAGGAAEYGEALRLRPGDRGFILGRADALISAGKSAEAIPLLRDALRVVEPDSKAHLLLGLAYQKTGQHKLARAEWTRTRQLDTTDDGILAKKLLNAVH